MKVQINFQVINPDFDQEYANEYKDGKESDSNSKYQWSKMFGVKEVKSVELIENGTHRMRGKFKDGLDFDIQIPNVSLFRCHLEDGSDLDFAVSKSILNKTHQVRSEKYKTTRCYFYINPEPKCKELGDYLVINENEIPKIFLE